MTTDQASQPAADPLPTAGAHRGPSPLTLGCSALAAIGLVFCALAGVSWWRADHDGTLSYARDRDAVLLAARQDIVVLNKLSYHDIDGGLQRWLAATTGSLHDQLSQVDATARKSIADAKTETSGTVIDAAVTQLDDRAGSAVVIASVEVSVTPDGGKAVLKRNRFSATLTRVGSDWKISDLQPVAVNLS